MKYTAKDLNEIADVFDTYASDQRAAKRWQSTKKAKDECETKAQTWEAAAKTLRETELVS